MQGWKNISVELGQNLRQSYGAGPVEGEGTLHRVQKSSGPYSLVRSHENRVAVTLLALLYPCFCANVAVNGPDPETYIQSSTESGEKDRI